MFPSGRILIVVAHPDDETLGCGGEMIRWPDCVIAHLTSGSPVSLADAHKAGFASGEAYAEARRRELDCALSLVGGRVCRSLGLTDQQTWHDLAALTESVRSLIEEIRPAAIVTHPYEGGHPDHDAAAFAVQFGCAAAGDRAPQRIEAAFYHRFGGRFHANEFIPGHAETKFELGPEDRRRKDAMFACFASQQGILELFSTGSESYRRAPIYNFSRPPHEGLLNYETLPWGITSGMWLASAARALDGFSEF